MSNLEKGPSMKPPFENLMLQEALKIENNRISLDSADIPFIDSKSTLPSIQLSEFLQPPKSTSTPFSNTLVEAQNDKPISNSTPLFQRPLDYSTPLFHFSPLDSFMNDFGSEGKDLSSISRLLSNESPLAGKNQVDSFREDIHSITDRIKNNVSLKNTSPISDDYYSKGDISIKDASSSLPDIDDDAMKTPTGSSGSSGTHHPAKSILRDFTSSSSGRPKKKVRINETVYVNPKPLEILTKGKKRRAKDDLAIRSSKKVKLLHKVDSNTSYTDLLALCGEEKDPIDLIFR